LSLHTFNTIAATTVAEYSVKGSKFIAYAYPVKDLEEVKTNLDLLRSQHPKAVHHCYAYKLSNQQFRANDDGEPSGTAGRPILGQLDSKQVSNVLVIVVRYFGGVLLGTSGLISAYKKATQDALQLAKIIECERQDHYQLEFNYDSLEAVMNFMKKRGITILSKDLDMQCVMEIEAATKFADQIIEELSPIVKITKT
jgi:uncharacterized YigZ family protein